MRFTPGSMLASLVLAGSILTTAAPIAAHAAAPAHQGATHNAVAPAHQGATHNAVVARGTTKAATRHGVLAGNGHRGSKRAITGRKATGSVAAATLVLTTTTVLTNTTVSTTTVLTTMTTPSTEVPPTPTASATAVPPTPAASATAVPPTPAASTAAPVSPDLDAARTQMLGLINAERAHASAGPLTLDGALNDVAQARSQDMIDRNYFAHQIPAGGARLPAGGMVFAILDHANVPYEMAGENIALNNYRAFVPLDQTVERTNTDLMNSPEHKDNILEPKYARIGLGVAFEQGTNKLILTEVFVQP